MTLNINIICKQKKKEEKYIKSFVKFYLGEYFPSIKNIVINCPDENNQQKAPDYFLKQLKISIEIKEAHSEVETKHSKLRDHSREKLQKALDKITKNSEFLRGTYYIVYPWHLKIKNDVEKIAQKIIESIQNNQEDIFIKGIGSFKVLKSANKYKEQKNRVILSLSISPVELINPATTIKINIESKIAKANIQLGALKARKKILLLANKYFWGNMVENFIEALSYIYKDLLGYKNIDEIWLQIKNETSNEPFYHLIYSRDFLVSLTKNKIKTRNEQHKQLFEKWFPFLTKLEDKYKEKLFFSLKKFLKDKKPHFIFKNKFVRQGMVRLGEWLFEKGKYNYTLWIIEKFIDDPDPEKPEKYSGDPEFNYHQKIVNGEDPIIITTVLGNLAWVIKKLATHKKHIVKALNYTEKLLTHKNLYVKLQAIFPLIEIAIRRQWLDGWGKRPRGANYKKFHKLVFDLVNLVTKNPNYRVIAKWLCNVFAYYKDLSTKEAEKVLDALKITEEAAGLFIYFAIFRKDHYKEQKIEFDEKIFEKKLKSLICNNEKEYLQLRRNIAWNFWLISKENPKEFEKIENYVDLFLEQPYQDDIYFHIESIIYDYAKYKPKISIEWYKKMLNKIRDFLKNIKDYDRQIYVKLNRSEHMLQIIAKENPDDFLEVIKILVNFWHKNCYIGNIKEIFESYKFLPDSYKIKDLKNELKNLYNSIKEINQNIENIEWD